MGFCAPMSSHLPPAQSPAAFMVFCYCGGSSLGWCGRGWALGTGTSADRPWSAVSMQVTSAGTTTRPARLCTEWRRSWAPGSLRRVPSSPHTTCFLSNKPLGGIQVGGIFSCLLNQLLFWSHIRSPAKPWTQERPVPRSTAGASRGFRRQSGWGVRASESEAKTVFRKSTGTVLQPLQGSQWPMSIEEAPLTSLTQPVCRHILSCTALKSHTHPPGGEQRLHFTDR